MQQYLAHVAELAELTKVANAAANEVVTLAGIAGVGSHTARKELQPIVDSSIIALMVLTM